VLGNSTLDLLEEDLLISKYGGVSGVNIGNHPTMLASYGHPTYRYSPNINFSCFGLTPLTIKRVGFFDEGFELAYFEDNDYHHRMNLEGVSSVCDNWAPFIHYGSRSIKEGGVKHEPYFTNNREYFKKKWGFVP
jgi:GT2 family glycosyltransferase